MMKKFIFLLLLALSACDLTGQSPSVVATSTQHVTANPFYIMDLINLHSNDAGKFTLVGGTKISSWAEALNSTTWDQSTDANRPLLTSGIPTFDGSNDQLVRASDISATTFSLFVVFKNTGGLVKILFGASSANDYCLHDGSINLSIGGVPKVRWLAGIGTARHNVLSIRRNGSTFIAKVNDRTLFENLNTYSAGTATLMARIMSNAGGGFNMSGEVKAICMTSQYLSDQENSAIVNALYSECGLSTDTNADNCIGFGDSNMVGSGATPHLPALAASLGVQPLNLGLTGTLFTNVGATSNNGYGRFTSQIITRPYTDYVDFCYGTNDVTAGVSASVYGAQLNEKIGELIAAGYNPSRICISSVPYQRDGANAALLDSYRSEILTVVSTYGVKYFDLLQYMRDNGGNSLLVTADNVHLNTTAQTAWGNGIYAALTSN